MDIYNDVNDTIKNCKEFKNSLRDANKAREGETTTTEGAATTEGTAATTEGTAATTEGTAAAAEKTAAAAEKTAAAAEKTATVVEGTAAAAEGTAVAAEGVAVATEGAVVAAEGGAVAGSAAAGAATGGISLAVEAAIIAAIELMKLEKKIEDRLEEEGTGIKEVKWTIRLLPILIIIFLIMLPTLLISAMFMQSNVDLSGDLKTMIECYESSGCEDFGGIEGEDISGFNKKIIKWTEPNFFGALFGVDSQAGKVAKHYSRYLEEYKKDDYRGFGIAGTVDDDENDYSTDLSLEAKTIEKYLLSEIQSFNAITWYENNGNSSTEITSLEKASGTELKIPKESKYKLNVDTYINLVEQHLQHWIEPYAMFVVTQNESFANSVYENVRHDVEVELYKLDKKKIVTQYYKYEEYDAETDTTNVVSGSNVTGPVYEENYVAQIINAKSYYGTIKNRFRIINYEEDVDTCNGYTEYITGDVDSGNYTVTQIWEDKLYTESSEFEEYEIDDMPADYELGRKVSIIEKWLIDENPKMIVKDENGNDVEKDVEYGYVDITFGIEQINDFYEEMTVSAGLGGGVNVDYSTLPAGQFGWPTPGYDRITSPYQNARCDPVDYPSGQCPDSVKKKHHAIDIAIPTGKDIVAAMAGKVKTASYQANGYGNYIVLEHDNGYTTLYAHMSRRLVQVGDEVTAGQAIGLAGSTGNSTGPHLHFEIKLNGTALDPEKVFNEQGNNPEITTTNNNTNTNTNTNTNISPSVITATCIDGVLNTNVQGESSVTNTSGAYVAGAPSQEMADMVAQAIKMANNGGIRYHQNTRQTATTVDGLDRMTISDCSAFVGSLYRVYLGFVPGAWHQTEQMRIYAENGETRNGWTASFHSWSDDVSELLPGDILYRSGHVGLYVGNGQQVDHGGPGGANPPASNPWRGPKLRSVGTEYTHYIRWSNPNSTPVDSITTEAGESNFSARQKPSTKAAIDSTLDSMTDEEIMARIIYGEQGGTSFEAQVLVGISLLNRGNIKDVAKSKYSNGRYYEYNCIEDPPFWKAIPGESINAARKAIEVKRTGSYKVVDYRTNSAVEAISVYGFYPDNSSSFPSTWNNWDLTVVLRNRSLGNYTGFYTP